MKLALDYEGQLLKEGQQKMGPGVQVGKAGLDDEGQEAKARKVKEVFDVLTGATKVPPVAMSKASGVPAPATPEGPPSAPQIRDGVERQKQILREELAREPADDDPSSWLSRRWRIYAKLIL